MNGSQLSSHARIGAIVLALATIAGFALAQSGAHAAPTGSTNARLRVLTVDKQAIMTGSKLGQNIKQQVLAYEDKLQADFGPEGEALQKEMDALQQGGTALSPDVRAKKTQELQTKEAAFRQKVQARQSLVQGGEMVARQRYLAEVGAIVHAIMVERGADLVIQKSSVVDSVDGADITQAAIQRLDQKMTSFKVPLVNPPANDTVQMH